MCERASRWMRVYIKGLDLARTRLGISRCMKRKCGALESAARGKCVDDGGRGIACASSLIFGMGDPGPMIWYFDLKVLGYKGARITGL